MKVNVLVFTQNLKLQSLEQLKSLIARDLPIVLVTTHKLFLNEIEQIKGIIGEFCELTFADLITDSEMERCDVIAYERIKSSVGEYYDEIMRLKNQTVLENLLLKYDAKTKFLLCDDLGVDAEVWEKNGFQKIDLRYYYEKNIVPENKKKTKGLLKYYLEKPIYSAKGNGIKYVFYGSLNRIGYRIDLNFKRDKFENWIFIITKFMERFVKKYPVRKKVEHISTIHESNGWVFPKCKNYKVGIIQDGYLPPNYSSKYLKYVNANVFYYAWDTLGMQVFKNQGISVAMLPYRKKLLIPDPKFRSIKTVLCVASGAGDWTALKNRSDEDNMIIAFVEIARRNPNIRFVYRCHPVWVHPHHQGVNSINRVAEYLAWTNLPNIALSANIPETTLSNFQLSYSRSSLESDLKGADVVFGEHSVSMIDAAFKGIPFASVNVTGRRDFFCGMTSYGFPHCESIEEIEKLIRDFNQESFQSKYKEAIRKYNEMTQNDM